MRAIIFVCHVLLAIGLFSNAHAQDLSPSAVFEAAAPSVVVVNGLDSSGTALFQGSGVVIAPNTVVSNCHVFTDAKSAQVIHQGKTYPATLLHGDSARDLCSFTVKGLHAPPVQLGSTTELKVGNRVFAIGAPQGFELTLSDGLLAGFRSVSDDRPVLQVTSPISPGSSGGGLFDSHGRLIGITTLYWKGSPQLNFAVPVEWVRELPARDATRRASELASAEDRVHQVAVDRAKASLQQWDAYMTTSDPTYSAKRDQLDRLVRTIRKTLPPPEWLSATIRAYAAIQPDAARTPEEASVRSVPVETRWQQIYEDDERTIAIDDSTYLKNGNLVTVWKLITLSSPSDFAGHSGVRSFKSRERFDCESRTISTSLAVLYSEDGAYLASVGNPYFSSPEAAVPGSLGEMALESLCH